MQDPRSEQNITNNSNVIKSQDILDIYIRDPSAEPANLSDESSSLAHIEFSGSDYIVSMNETTK